MSLSTLDGQRAHYQDVRERLFNSQPPAAKPAASRTIVLRADTGPKLPIATPRPELDKGRPRVFAGRVRRLRCDAGIPKDLPPERGPEYVRIIVSVARKHGVKPADIVGPMRKAMHYKARQEAMYLMCCTLRLSKNKIGKLLGRNHTSVVRGVMMHMRRTGAPPPDATFRPYKAKSA